MVGQRPLLRAALTDDLDKLDLYLHEEERREKEVDREYWQPLRRELEHWLQGRHA